MAEGMAQFDFRTATGKLILSENHTMENGENTLKLAIKKLSSGMYFIQVKDATNKTANVKMIKN